MPRTCTICTSEHRAEIDRALVRRVAYRNIAEQHDVSPAALSRHAQDHLPDKLRRAEEADQQAEADELLNDLRKIQVSTVRVLRQAENAGPEFMGIVLRAVAEQRKNIELKLRASDWKALEERVEAIEEAQNDAKK